MKNKNVSNVENVCLNVINEKDNMDYKLDDKEIDRVIRLVLGAVYNENYALVGTREDFYNDLQIFVRERKEKFDGTGATYVYVSMKNYMKWLLHQYFLKSPQWLSSFDETVSCQDGDLTIEDVIGKDEIDINEIMFIDQLNSIKDKNTRDLLVIIGYLVCNINCLQKEYVQILSTYTDKSIVDKLNFIEESLAEEEKSDVEKPKKYKRILKVDVVGDIIEATKMNYHKISKMIDSIELVKVDRDFEIRRVRRILMNMNFT